MGRLENKIAFVSGAARGMGREHALAMAREGADIIATDICEQLNDVPYAMSTPEDLDETKRLVESEGRRCVAIQADSRDLAVMERAVQAGVDELGGLDIAVVNHGIVHITSWDTITEDEFDLMIDINLKSVWKTSRAVIPHLVERGSGSLILTASAAGIRPFSGLLSYTAAKHGVVGLAKALAAELAPHWIRVNALCPGNVGTPMFFTQHLYDAYSGHPDGTLEEAKFPMQAGHLLPLPWLEPEAVASSVVFLASDDAKYITGTAFSVDAGMTNQAPGVSAFVGQRMAEIASG